MGSAFHALHVPHALSHAAARAADAMHLPHRQPSMLPPAQMESLKEGKSPMLPRRAPPMLPRRQNSVPLSLSRSRPDAPRDDSDSPEHQTAGDAARAGEEGGERSEGKKAGSVLAAGIAGSMMRRSFGTSRRGSTGA